MKTTANIVGTLTGAALGVLLAALSVYVLALPADSYGAINAIYILIVAGAPLLLLLLGATIPIWREGGRGRKLAMVWLPVLLGGAILPAKELVDGIRHGALTSVHPPVQERHVNLSGGTIRVAKFIELDGMAPDRFEQASRYPAREHEWRKVYAGRQLAPGFKTAPVYQGVLAKARPALFPVVLSGSYPDLSGMQEDAEPMFLYYYYRDRVEVAPSFSLSSTGEDSVAARGIPLIDVITHNLGALPIVRLEIDGQALGLNGAIEPIEPGICMFYGKPIINRLAAPLRVRWQYAQPNAAWHEARVAVPLFRSQRGPAGAVTSNEVHLYMDAGGGVGVQRAQLLDQGAGKRAIRFTQPYPAFKKPPACGTADNYEESVARFPD